MRPSSLRRRVSYGAMSAGMVAAVLVPLTAAAAGSPCPTYEDPAGDAAPVDAALAPLLQDDSLDLLSLTHSTAGGVFTTVFQVGALHDYGSEYSIGDWFDVNFTVAEKAVIARVVRDANIEGTTTTRITIDGKTQEFAPEAEYDFEAATVILTVKQADLEKAIGTPLKGKPFSAMRARALGNYAAFGATWDIATAAPEVVYTFGDACKPGAAKPRASADPSAAPSPSGTASPEPSPSASPEGRPAPPEPAVPVPAPGCIGFADEEGDARPAVGPASPGYDADLDLLSVTGRTTQSTLSGHLGIKELAGRPSFPAFSGHRFEYEFGAAGKTVVLRANGTGEGTGLIDGATSSDLVVTAVFDEPSSQVVLTVDRASLVKALGQPLPDGAVLTHTAARSYARTAATVHLADTARTEEPAPSAYVVGDNECFLLKMSVTGPAEVQTSDVAVVNVALTTSDGRIPKDQKVTAWVGGGRAVTVSTDKAGTATLNVPVIDAAGAAELVVRSAGDGGEGELRSEVRVLVEGTLLSVARSGSGGTRTLTAILTDDDEPRRPLSGQRMTFSFDGRTVAVTTNAAGRAAASVPAGSTVEVAFAGRPGFLRASKVRTTA